MRSNWQSKCCLHEWDIFSKIPTCMTSSNSLELLLRFIFHRETINIKIRLRLLRWQLRDYYNSIECVQLGTVRFDYYSWMAMASHSTSVRLHFHRTETKMNEYFKCIQLVMLMTLRWYEMIHLFALSETMENDRMDIKLKCQCIKRQPLLMIVVCVSVCVCWLSFYCSFSLALRTRRRHTSTKTDSVFFVFAFCAMFIIRKILVLFILSDNKLSPCGKQGDINYRISHTHLWQNETARRELRPNSPKRIQDKNEIQ